MFLGALIGKDKAFSKAFLSWCRASVLAGKKAFAQGEK
jgi:hypothetical protein